MLKFKQCMKFITHLYFKTNMRTCAENNVYVLVLRKGYISDTSFRPLPFFSCCSCVCKPSHCIFASLFFSLSFYLCTYYRLFFVHPSIFFLNFPCFRNIFFLCLFLVSFSFSFIFFKNYITFPQVLFVNVFVHVFKMTT